MFSYTGRNKTLIQLFLMSTEVKMQIETRFCQTYNFLNVFWLIYMYMHLFEEKVD